MFLSPSQAEKDEFGTPFRAIAFSRVLKDVYFYSSYTFYKLKERNDESFILRAFISPHGNEDSFKNDFHSDC